jgi:D-Tyr-tRNAtyr deacylase
MMHQWHSLIATAPEDSTLTVNAANGVLANDSDVDGDPLSVTQFTVAGDATVYSAGQTATIAGVGTLQLNADGSYVFSPAANYNGNVPVATYTVSDGTTTSTSTLTLSVTPANDAPVAQSDSNSTAEDSTLTVNAANGVLANDSDVDGDPLSVTQFTVAGDATVYSAGQTATIAGVGTLQLNADGSYVFSPAANYNGNVPVATYTVSDGTTTSTSTLTLSVTPANDAPVAQSDSNSTAEDSTLTVNAANGVLANDSDVDGDPLSVTQFTVAGDATVYSAGQTATIAGVGTLQLNADGSYVFSPAANYNGNVPVATYTVSDGTTTSTSTLTLSVTPANDAPVAQSDSNSTAEDSTLTVNAANGVLANDSDVDGDPLSVTQFTVAGDATVYSAGQTATIAGVGTLQLNADGSYVFSPAANYNGNVPVATYTVSDGTTTSTSTLTLSVTPANDAPVAQSDSNSTAEDSTLTVNAANGVLANDSDVDGDPLSVTQFTVAGDATVYSAGQTATIAGVGTLQLNADGSYVFSPAANYNGNVPVATYTVSDGTTTSTSTLTLSVTPANDAPVAQSDSNSTAEDSTLTVNAANGVLANDSDVDGDPLSVTQFTVAGDATVYSAGQTATIAGVGTLQLNADGSYVFSPAANYNGNVPVATYTVSDGTTTSTSTLTLSVTPANDAPVAQSDSNSTAEDSTLTVNAANGVLANDSDVDGDPLSVTQFTVAGDATVYSAGQTATIAGVGTLQLNADGSYVFSPAANYNGNVPVATYTVSDGTTTSTSTLTLSVTPANDAPVAQSDSNSTAEDSTLTVNAANGVLANDSDVDGDPLSVTQFTVAGDATVYSAGQTATIAGVGTLQLNADGSYVFSPAANYNGNVPVATYTVSDGTTTSTSTLTLSVTPANDAPVAQSDSNSTAEDSTLTVNAANGVLANDSDVDGDPLSVTQFTVAGDATVYSAGQTATIAGVGTLQLNADGSYVFSPAANYNGNVPVATYTVSDGTTTSTSTLTLSVTPANDAPVAQSDSNSTAEDSTLTVNAANGVLANDSDVDGDPLSVTQFTVAGDATVYSAGQTATIAGVGTLQLNADGSYVFSPAANYNGNVPVATYTVSDGTTTSTSTLTLSVTPANDAPVAQSDSNSTAEDSTLTVNAANGVLANDSDVDGDPLSVTQFTVAGDATVYSAGQTATIAGVGTLQLNADGSYVFSPAANYNGNVPVATYTVSDGTTTSTSTLTLSVTPANDAPVAQSDSNSTAEDSTLTVNAANGVLANDSDVDGDPLSVTQFTVAGDATVYSAGQTATIAGVGTLQLNADGSYVFSPAANYNGNVPVATYTVSDGTTTSTSTLTLSVTPANDAPVAQSDSNSTAEDSTLTVNAANGVLANDSDVDGDPLSVTQFTVAGDATVYSAGQTATIAGVGTLQLNADGSYVFSPAANYNGNVPVATYTVSDGTTTSTSTLTLSVTPANDAPVAQSDSNSTAEDSTLTVNAANGVLANDSDVDGDPLSVTQFTVAGDATVYSAGQTATIAGVGTLQLNADGSYVFSPAANYNGSVPVATYTVSDGTATVTSTLTLTVTPVNDAPTTQLDNYTRVEGTTGSHISVLTNDSDVDGDTLTVAQFATNASGTGAQTANGSNTITTVLGGTVTMNSNGTFSYVAPIRNHGNNGVTDTDGADVDSFYYKATDGTLQSGWTQVNITITDTAPVAQNDSASVAIGDTVTGNVITGTTNGIVNSASVDTQSWIHQIELLR